MQGQCPGLQAEALCPAWFHCRLAGYHTTQQLRRADTACGHMGCHMVDGGLMPRATAPVPGNVFITVTPRGCGLGLSWFALSSSWGWYTLSAAPCWHCRLLTALIKDLTSPRGALPRPLTVIRS